MTPWDPSLTNEPSIPLVSNYASSSPSSVSPQPGPSKAPHAVRKVQSGKVEKKKSKKKDKGGTTPSSQAGRFVIVTPTSITAQAGRPNPYDCFSEAHRASHRGRKGPLANGTKESALQVRRLGACFCCHSRKVKCDKERPCRNCVKLAVGAPHVVCWQFQDFLPVLFPGFVRTHFRAEDMARFMEENVGGFGGEGGGFEVELFSGPRFRSVLAIPGARFFAARSEEVLTHWHLHAEAGGVDLRVRGAVPIGLEPGGMRGDEVRKRAKAYVRSILAEPAFAEQLTETFRHTGLPRRVLEIVQRYWVQSEVCPPSILPCQALRRTNTKGSSLRW
ncbi:Zn(II)2Cys6 transcription factor [Candidatus Bathyarchaeota archaeon]|nr:Zn(II)2Cys6 transcription factor [Candidatus Bathyarchaeota archaeon]